MVEEFRKYLTDNALVGSGDRVLLAVSGGIDSMVMAHLFRTSGISAGIAHCNFRLRGTESDGDEAFVRRYASRHKLQFHKIRFDTTGYASEKGISVQMAARELRYRWFEEIRSAHGYNSVAVAHNMNDNVETFLINLTRGTGIAGLTGMRPVHDRIIRPLLFASRKAITEYSRRKRISFREDRSNSNIKYTRNKIRHSIIPLFCEINPSFESTITETADRLGEINQMVSSFIRETRQKLLEQRRNYFVLKLDELEKISQKRTILFELLRPFGISSDQVGQVTDITKKASGTRIFTGSHRILKDRNQLIITPLGEADTVSYLADSIDDLKAVPLISSAESVERKKGFAIPSSQDTACIDAAKIRFPLSVRKWKHGDFFFPLGMNSRKKLSDYFIDRKFSVAKKDKCMILETEGKIVWIIGERLDNRFKVTVETKKILLIKASK